MATRRQGKVQRPSNTKLAPKKGPAAAKPKVIYADKKEDRVWNLSDHPGTPGAGNVLSLVGRNVAPGRAVRVPKDVLEKSKRLQKLVDDGLVHVGPTPPPDYLAAKNKVKATVPRTHMRTHGIDPIRKALMVARKAENRANEVAAETAAAAEKAKLHFSKSLPGDKNAAAELKAALESDKLAQEALARASSAKAEAQDNFIKSRPTKAAEPAKAKAAPSTREARKAEREAAAAPAAQATDAQVAEEQPKESSGGGRKGRL